MCPPSSEFAARRSRSSSLTDNAQSLSHDRRLFLEELNEFVEFVIVEIRDRPIGHSVASALSVVTFSPYSFSLRFPISSSKSIPPDPTLNVKDRQPGQCDNCTAKRSDGLPRRRTPNGGRNQQASDGRHENCPEYPQGVSSELGNHDKSVAIRANNRYIVASHNGNPPAQVAGQSGIENGINRTLFVPDRTSFAIAKTQES